MKDCLEYFDRFEMEISVLKDLIKNSDNDRIKELLEYSIEEKNNQLKKNKNILESIASNDICCRLYAKILRGKPPTRAVEEVANENYFNNIKPYSVSSIWRYYLKIKKLID